MSVDLAASVAPQTDEYDYEAVLRANPHDVMRSRKARPRMFDCICKHSMTLAMSSKQYSTKILVFDGIDPRGASRPYKEAREPCMYSNNEQAKTFLARAPDAPITAEGDLKLTDIESEIQYLRDSKTFFVSIKLVLVCTIDTDSIAIEMMHQSAKNDQRAARRDLREPIKTVLCFREAARKRKGEESEHTPASFACFDMEAVHKSIITLLEAPVGYHRHATTLLASAWSLCGSDFVRLKGMRSDVAFEATSELCKSDDGVKLLKQMEPAWELRRDTNPQLVRSVRASMVQPILQIVENTALRLSMLPRMARSANAMKAVMDCQETTRTLLLRSAWCAVYWSGLQCPNTELRDWGFTNITSRDQTSNEFWPYKS